MTVGNKYIVTGDASQIPGAAYAKVTFGGTEIANDGTQYSSDAGNDDHTLGEAGNYLGKATIHLNDASAGRCGIKSKFTYSGTGDFVTVLGSGYTRDANNDDCAFTCWFFVRNAGASDTVAVEWIRGSDAATGGTVAAGTHLEIVQWEENQGIGLYSSTSTASMAGTTWTDVAYGTTVHESDTAKIEKATDNYTLKTSGARYLVIGGYAGDMTSGVARTQRVVRAVDGSTEIDASFGYAYSRQTSAGMAAPQSMFLVERGGADIVLSMQGQRGNAEGDGTWAMTSGESGLIILELSSGVEVAAFVDGTGGQVINGAGPTNINAARTPNFIDTASFTDVADEVSVNCVQSGDVLAWANVGGDAGTTTSTARLTRRYRLEIAGADQDRGAWIGYLRNDQGATGTRAVSYHPSGIYTVTAGQDFQCEFEDTNAWDNGVTADVTVANQVGIFTINLDTLSAGATNTIVSVPVATLTLTGNDPVAATGASWDEAENTAHEANVTAGDENTRLRIQIRNDGAGSPATQSLKWQYNYSGDAGWNDLTSTSTYLKTYNSGGFANGDDLTVKLLSGAEDFLTNNNAAVDAAAADATFTMTDTFLVGDVTESEVALTVVSADVADSTTITLRLVELRGSVEIPTTLTNTPTINVTKAGGDATISVPSATLTLTPNAPTVVQTDKHVIDIPLETLTLTPNAPTVLAEDNKLIDIPLETLTLTPNTPTVDQTAKHLISIPLETLALTPNAPTVVQTDKHVIDVPLDALTLTSFAPTVVQTDKHVIDVPLDALTLATASPIVSIAYNSFPPLVSLVLAEQTPAVVQTDHHVINPPTETLTLSEKTPTVLAEDKKLIDVPSGALSLTAFAPTVVETDRKLVELPTATLTLSEQTPTIGETDLRLIEVPLETLVLAEQTPTIVQTDHHVIDVPVAPLTLTEQTPTIVQTDYHVINPPAETLVIATQAPTAKETKNISIPLATLTLSEKTPTVLAENKKLIDVPEKALALTTFAPTIGQTDYHVINPPTRSLALSEQTPTMGQTDYFAASVPLATLTITEQTPTIGQTDYHVIDVPVAALTLSEQTPTALRSNKINVPAEALVLTEQTPTVLATDDKPVDVPLATLSLTTAAPTVNITNKINVPEAALTFTAIAPTIVQTDYHVRDIPTSELVFTSYAPTVQAWGEVPTDDTNIWTEVPTADTETWTGISTGAETWTPISTGAETWTEVPTSDTEQWVEIPTKS